MNDTGRSVLIVILVLILVPVLWATVMMGGMGPGMMGGWGWGNGGWSPWQGLLATLSTVLVIGGVVALIWWALAREHRAGTSTRDGRDARRILDERYARGELTRDQYRQMRDDLES